MSVIDSLEMQMRIQVEGQAALDKVAQSTKAVGTAAKEEGAKLDELTAHLAETAEGHKELGDEVELSGKKLEAFYKRAAAAAKQEYDNAQRAIQALERQAQLAGKSGSEKLNLQKNFAIQDFGRTEEQIQRITSAYDKLGESQKKTFAQMAGDFVRNPFGTLGDAAEGFLTKLGPGGAAVAAFGSLLVLGAKQAKDMADELGETARQIQNFSLRTGLSVEGTQLFTHAAQLAGVNAQSLEASTRKLSEAMADSGLEGKKSGEALQRLGVSAYGATGQLRPMDDLLPEIFRKLGEVSNHADRVVLANEVLGRSAKELLPLIQNYDQFAEKVKQAGVIIDAEGIAKADRYRQSVELLAQKWERIVNVFKQKAVGIVSLVIQSDGSLAPADLKKMGIDLGAYDPDRKNPFELYQAAAKAGFKPPQAGQSTSNFFQKAEQEAADKDRLAGARSVQSRDKSRFGSTLAGAEEAYRGAEEKANKASSEYLNAPVPTSALRMEWEKTAAEAAKYKVQLDAIRASESQLKEIPKFLEQLDKISQETLDKALLGKDTPQAKLAGVIQAINDRQASDTKQRGIRAGTSAYNQADSYYDRERRAATLTADAEDKKRQDDLARNLLKQQTDYAGRTIEAQIPHANRIAELTAPQGQDPRVTIGQSIAGENRLAQQKFLNAAKANEQETDPAKKTENAMKAAIALAEELQSIRIKGEDAIAEKENQIAEKRREAEKQIAEASLGANKFAAESRAKSMENMRRLNDAPGKSAADSVLQSMNNRLDLTRQLAAIDQANIEKVFKGDQLRVEQAKLRAEIDKENIKAQLDAENKLAELQKQRDDQARQAAGQIYDVLKSGGQGLTPYIKDLANQQTKTIFQNVASGAIGNAFGGLGTIIPGQKDANGNLTKTGEALKGTLFGVQDDPKSAMKSLDARIKDQTLATQDNTKALRGEGLHSPAGSASSPGTGSNPATASPSSSGGLLNNLYSSTAAGFLGAGVGLDLASFQRPQAINIANPHTFRPPGTPHEGWGIAGGLAGFAGSFGMKALNPGSNASNAPAAAQTTATQQLTSAQQQATGAVQDLTQALKSQAQTDQDASQNLDNAINLPASTTGNINWGSILQTAGIAGSVSGGSDTAATLAGIAALGNSVSVTAPLDQVPYQQGTIPSTLNFGGGSSASPSAGGSSGGFSGFLSGLGRFAQPGQGIMASYDALTGLSGDSTAQSAGVVAGTAAAIAAGTLTAVQKFEKGGAQGVLGGVGSLSLMAGSMAGGPSNPVGATLDAIGAGSELIAALLPSARQKRLTQMQLALQQDQYVAPPTINATTDTAGYNVGFNKFGLPNSLPSMGMNITQPQQQYFNGGYLTVPGSVLENTATGPSQVYAPSPYGGQNGGPNVSITVHALDSQSILDRSSDIGQAVIKEINGGGAVGQRIQNTVFGS